LEQFESLKLSAPPRPTQDAAFDFSPSTTFHRFVFSPTRSFQQAEHELIITTSEGPEKVPGIG
jgi:hypothetical protein